MASEIMQVSGSSPSRLINFLGFCLFLSAGLNINAMLLMLTGTEAILSPILLIIVSVVLFRCAEFSKISVSYALFATMLGSYLILSVLVMSLTSALEWSKIAPYTGYPATILFVSAIYFWLRSIDEKRFVSVLSFFKYLLLVSCLSVIFTDTLRPYQAYRTFNEIDRASGFFDNPNEAAIAALFCITLVLNLPDTRYYMRAIQFAVAAIAVVMTFSKTGMLISLILVSSYVVTRRSVTLAILTVIITAGVFATLWFVFERDLLSLSWEQRERLADVLNLIDGDINTTSTTGRNLLLDFGLDKILTGLPWGLGLGQFHAMEGGYRNTLNEWLGIHNTFLMILGEGGVVPFTLFIGFWISLLVSGRRAPYRGILYGFSLILIGDMMTSHNVLLLRVENVGLAVIMALAASPVQEARQVMALEECPMPDRELAY